MFIKNVESLIKRNEQLTKKNKELEKKVFDLIHNPSKAFNYQNEMKQLIEDLKTNQIHVIFQKTKRNPMLIPIITEI